MATQHIVKAPLVLVKDETGATQYLYQGASVPDFVQGEDLKRLLDEGFIAKGSEIVAQPEGEEPTEEEPEGEGDGATQAPSASASKGTWVAYATDPARGEQQMTREDAEALTRDKLAERFSA